jgi:Peptidase family M23
VISPIRLLPPIIGLLILAVSVHPASSSNKDSNPVSLYRVKQGDVLYLPLHADNGTTGATGRFLGRSIPFFKTAGPGQFAGLVGIDLADPPSRQDLVVDITSGSGSVKRQQFAIQILPAHFQTQELTVPKNYVDLDDETLKRVENEQEQILKSLNAVTNKRLWAGPFIMPVKGELTGSFGRKRMINGEPRSPHSGEDIKAPRGTEVHAANGGVVALVGEYFFSGKSVILDHGLGFYSMYFHLDEVDVVKGEKVQKGAVVGRVGSTGRATGPHLHWGTRINGARVNPLSMLNIK